jgi:hypothetical protein
LLVQLRAQRSIVAAKKAQKAARLKVEAEIAAKLEDEAIPELDINKDLLTTFSNEEQRTILQYFKNVRQTPKDIETATGIAYQKVSKLLNSEAFKLLRHKVMQEVDESLRIESLLTLRQVVRSGRLDKTTIDLLLKKLGATPFDAVDSTKTNGSTPLYDSDLELHLKRLGEDYVNKKRV